VFYFYYKRGKIVRPAQAVTKMKNLLRPLNIVYQMKHEMLNYRGNEQGLHRYRLWIKAVSAWWTEAEVSDPHSSIAGWRQSYIRCRVTVCCGLCTLIGLLDVTVGVTFSDIHFASAKHKPIYPHA